MIRITFKEDKMETFLNINRARVAAERALASNNEELFDKACMEINNLQKLGYVSELPSGNAIEIVEAFSQTLDYLVTQASEAISLAS